MTPTEEICARLDELGVEYDTYDLPNGEHGLSWIDGNDIEWEVVQQGENFRIHALQLVTPEQTIALAVGAGTCHIEVHDNLAETEGMGEVWLECDECHWQMPLEPTTLRFKYCPNCGARIEKGKDNGMGQE